MIIIKIEGKSIKNQFWFKIKFENTYYEKYDIKKINIKSFRCINIRFISLIVYIWEMIKKHKYNISIYYKIIY